MYPRMYEFVPSFLSGPKVAFSLTPGAGQRRFEVAPHFSSDGDNQELGCALNKGRRAESVKIDIA